MQDVTQLKSLKEFKICKNLEILIRKNSRNNLANLDLLYTVNRENIIHLLRSEDSRITYSCSQSIAMTIVHLIKADKDFLKDTIKFFANEYQIDFHSLHVAIYSVNIGCLLGFDEKKLVQLTLAALFMDIGLKAVNANITDSTLSLHELKQEHLQQHPQYSINILEHNHIHDPYIIEGILHHHERYDGSGYPKGLQEREISPFSAILGICDTFDALTNERPYRKRLTYFEALKFMINDPSMKNKFNISYLKIFLKSLL